MTLFERETEAQYSIGSFMTLCLSRHYSESNAGAVTIAVVVVGILVASGILMVSK